MNGDAVRDQLARTVGELRAENERLRVRIDQAQNFLSEWEGPLSKADGHKFGSAAVALSLAMHGK